MASEQSTGKSRAAALLAAKLRANALVYAGLLNPAETRQTRRRYALKHAKYVASRTTSRGHWRHYREAARP